MKAFVSVAGTMTAGPRLEMFRELVCRSYTEHVETPSSLSLPPNTMGLHNATIDGFVDCASNPDVQADVAKLVAGTWFVHGHALLFTNYAIPSYHHH